MKKRNIYLLYAISLLQGMIFYGPVATLYRQAAGISVFQITLIESISVALMILLEVPWGRVVRTWTAVLAVAGILLLRMIYALFLPLQTNLQNRAITVDDRATTLSLHAMLLDSTAIFTLSCKRRIKYSTCGVFPEPPTVILPTEMTGIEKSRLFFNPMSKSQLRNLTMLPYIQLSGSSQSLIFIRSPSVLISSLLFYTLLYILMYIQYEWHCCLHWFFFLDVANHHKWLVEVTQCES